VEAIAVRPWGAKLFGLAAIALVLSLGISGCASTATLPDAFRHDAAPVSHSMIFIVHGDGQYVYLDQGGQTRKADEVTVGRAMEIARQNPNAEVLIFHEQPQKRSFLFFRRPDGRFYYYRNGREQYSDSFRRSTSNRLRPIVRRVEHFASRADVRMLFYFGHEIPEIGGEGYDASYPLREFTVRDFSTSVDRMAEATGRFHLITLASCFGGTPETVRSLGRSADHVIASPDNLHLSYLDLSVLSELESAVTSPGEVAAFADTLARRSFERLTASVHTAVSLAVYDTQRTGPYLQSVAPIHHDLIAGLPTQANLTIEHFDCGRDDAYRDETMTEGVRLYYRPARFGRHQDVSDHSGWTCWRPGR
jgi:hypothetical protein